MALPFKGPILSRVTEVSLFSISLLFAFAVCVPWVPDFATTGLDPSWKLSLHYFFEHGYVFGKDIIFTYGPYGFISTYVYYPATYRIMFLASLFCATVYTAAGWDILRKAIKNKGVLFSAVLVATLFWAPVPNNSYSGDTFFYSCGILFFASYLAESDKPYRVRNFFLVGILAASSLMKYSFLMWAVVILSFVSLDGIFFRKKAPFLFLLYFCTLAVLWVLAKQPLAGLGTFLLTGAHVARYYGSAMSFLLTTYYLRLTYFLVFSLGFVAVFYSAQWRRTGRRAILPSLALVAMTFLIFRASFTRPDHYTVAMSYLAVSAIFIIPFLGGNLRTKGWKICLAFLMIIALSLGYIFGLKPLDPSFFAATERIWNSISMMPYYTFVESRFLPHPIDLERRHNSIRNAIRWLNPVPLLSGTVDVYPFDSTGLIAWDLSYKPRPVFQSYAAYTSFLSRKNADRLKSSDAPDFLVFGPNITENGRSIDARYPTLDDSLSLPEIMSRYDFIAILRKNALLQKASSPRPYSFKKLGNVTAKFGEVIPVPCYDQGPVWVEIDIRSTWRGKIFEFLGRAGRPIITAKDRNGIAYTYQLPPVMSQTGFLLSPVLNDPAGFIAFWIRHYENGGLFHKEAVDFKIEVPAAYKGFFVPKFQVRFFELKI